MREPHEDHWRMTHAQVLRVAHAQTGTHSATKTSTNESASACRVLKGGITRGGASRRVRECTEGRSSMAEAGTAEGPGTRVVVVIVVVIVRFMLVMLAMAGRSVLAAS